MVHKITVFILFLILSFSSNSWADSNWGTLIWGQDNWFFSLPGDVNSDETVDLEDTILILKLIAGIDTTEEINLGADVNDDGKISIEEVIYTLQVISGLKP
jgi:hypothetical protein